jgi:cold shock CspA family protein
MADLLASLQSAAGAAGDENLYIEDVFSTTLYTGNSSTQTITNGIDLDGEGGMVWFAARGPSAFGGGIYDSERDSFTKRIQSFSTAAQNLELSQITSVSSSGFSLGPDNMNGSGQNYVAWTFRKAAPKFFDIVTYTGTGVNRTVAHNLGSVPGCMIVKSTSVDNWTIYHRSLGATKWLQFNTGAAQTASSLWNDTAPTSTEFTVGTATQTNDSGETFVAYLFAHDDGGFGDDGDENVISCGSYTGNGGTQSITVGFEPQWLLIKRTNGADNWAIMDSMRNFIVSSSSDSSYLAPNLSNAEANVGRVHPNATGFGFISEANGVLNGSGDTYIYIAIRRGPMKTPTAGTEVYNAGVTQNNTGRTVVPELGYPPDLALTRTSAVSQWFLMSRLTGGGRSILQTQSTVAALNFGVDGFDNNATFKSDGIASLGSYGWMFRRAPGFFDVVCYTGTSTQNRAVNHNLTVTPELLIVKQRNSTSRWTVLHTPTAKYGYLNETGTFGTEVGYAFGDSIVPTYVAPTSTTFTVANYGEVNGSGSTYVAYLFASLAGVSDIGTYTGNGTSVSVTTGFQPRFILVKRTDSTGNWYVGDSARGLVAGDDPFLLLNSVAAETTNQDWVDVSATGFTINETAANANVNTGTYIYLAIS